MKIDIKAHRKITTISDMARLFGLRASAAPDQISRQFGRLVNFEAGLEIEVAERTTCAEEIWQVRIEKALPRPRVWLRPAGRGRWSCQADEIPLDVLDHFGIRTTRDGRMETRRSWRAWERTNWSKGSGKRLKSRHGEIQALVEIPAVRRATGERDTFLRIESVIDDDMQAPGPVRIALPCTAGVLVTAISALRAVPIAA